VKILSTMMLGAAAVGATAFSLAGCHDILGAKYSVGGTLTGLTGSGLQLQDNSGNNLPLNSNGGFAFSGSLQNGDAYSVTVSRQPSNPTQSCTVRNGSGTIDRANVTNVIVSCTQTGRFAFVANQLSNDISAFAIDAANGALAPIAGSPFAAMSRSRIEIGLHRLVILALSVQVRELGLLAFAEKLVAGLDLSNAPDRALVVFADLVVGVGKRAPLPDAAAERPFPQPAVAKTRRGRAAVLRGSAIGAIERGVVRVEDFVCAQIDECVAGVPGCLTVAAMIDAGSQSRQPP